MKLTRLDISIAGKRQKDKTNQLKEERVVRTYKTFSEMGLNYRIVNFIKVMFDPFYGSDMMR